MRERRGALGSGAVGTALPAGQKARPESPGLKVLLVFSSGFSCSFLIPRVRCGGGGRGGNSGAGNSGTPHSAAGRGLLFGVRLPSQIGGLRCLQDQIGGDGGEGGQATSLSPPPVSRYSEGSPRLGLNPPPAHGTRRHGELRGAPQFPPPHPSKQLFPVIT